MPDTRTVLLKSESGRLIELLEVPNTLFPTQAIVWRERVFLYEADESHYREITVYRPPKPVT